ncbi:MAG: hypothetical protein LBM98_10110 [Oscillospiraceae bacterium]|nr:hypothetical protein [Oscillospiraceae bacterium]
MRYVLRIGAKQSSSTSNRNVSADCGTGLLRRYTLCYLTLTAARKDGAPRRDGGRELDAGRNPGEASLAPTNLIAYLVRAVLQSRVNHAS